MRNQAVPVLLSCTLVLAMGCGATSPVSQAPPPQALSRWTYVSEFEAVDLLATSSGTIWAVTEAGLMRGSVDGSGWTDVKGLSPEGQPHPFRCLMMDSDGGLWVAGESMVAQIASGTANRFTSIEQSLHTVTGLAQTQEGVHVVGGSKVATRADEQWTVQQMPFEIHSAAATGQGLWLAAGEQGLALVAGDEVNEYPDPLEGRDAEREIRSLVVRGEEVWTLWVGSEGCHVARLLEGTWNIWAVPEVVGDPMRLMGSGRDVYLQTPLGLFVLQSAGSYPLQPLLDPVEAVTFSYLSEPGEPGDAEDGVASAPDAAPVERLPEPVPSLEVGAGHKYTLEPMALDQVKIGFWSPVTSLAGDGQLAVVGTLSTGTYVLDGQEVKNVIAPYAVRPRIPMTSFAAEDRFFYVLAEGGKAGVVENGDFSARRITADQHENLLALYGTDGQGYAISLVPEFETLQFFEYGDGGFVKMLDRPVEIASGISDVGGFLGRPDGSFWFTIISAAENLEMGVGAVHPSLEYIVYHGSVPMPPEQAVTIPNGVRHITEDHQGNIWLGGMEGAVMLDADLNASVYKEPQGLVGDMVTDLVVDETGKVWALTVDGLGWFMDGDWKFPDEPPFRGGIIDALGLDASDRLLIADQEAIYRKVGMDWTVVVARKDLPGMEVLDVEAGAQGRLWVVTERAIAISPEP